MVWFLSKLELSKYFDMNTNETIENSPQKETKLINRHAYIKQLLSQTVATILNKL